jgi:hypothetical protein
MFRNEHACHLSVTAVLLIMFPCAACTDATALQSNETNDQHEPSLLRAEAEDEAAAAPASAPARVAPNVDAQAVALFPEGLCDAVYALRAHGPEGLDAPYTVGLGETTPDVPLELPWGTREVQVVGWEPLIDNKKVLHHVSLYDRSVNIMGWSPGKVGYPYPPGVGIDMPTTPGLRLDLHYVNTTNEPTRDRSGIALCVVEGEHRRPKSSVKYGSFSTVQRVMVPANARDHELTGQCTVRSTEPVSILSVSPHAHLLARHARLAVTKPDGTEHVLHDDSFAWAEQPVYLRETPYLLEPGDTVKWMCRYDNDTNRNIPFGESSFNEMCILWAEYYPKGALRCSR